MFSELLDHIHSVGNNTIGSPFSSPNLAKAVKYFYLVI